MARADVEAEQRKQRRLESRGAAPDEEDSGRRKSALWEPMMDTATGHHADGSFSQAGVRVWQRKSSLSATLLQARAGW